MKTLRTVLVLLTGLLLLNPTAGRAAVDFEFFYDELSPYGDWVEVDDYGYCFQPYDAGGDWRPYSDGYWADSDEGWVWVSNEPHGWATYHYGRWANITGRGWVWVPGYEWGPGWVSWRESNDYVGWAPLPPQVGWRPQTGIRFGVSFGFGDVGPGYYNFIEPRYFGYPRMRDHVLPYDRNVNIIEQTTNITNITNVVNNNRTVIYNNGPNRDFLRQRSERPIRRLNIERSGDDLTAAQLRNRRVRNEIEGDRYRVVSPKVQHAEGAKPKKVAGHVRRDQIDDGYARVADKNRADEIRKRIRAQADDPKNQKNAGTASKPKDGNRPDTNVDDKPGNARKRDEVLNRQAEIEKRPKDLHAKQREERDRAAQEKVQREQVKEQAGNAGNKPGKDTSAGVGSNANERARSPGQGGSTGKPHSAGDTPNAGRPKLQEQASRPKSESNSPQGKPQQQPTNSQRKPESQQGKPQNKSQQREQPKPQQKPEARKNQASRPEAKPQGKPDSAPGRPGPAQQSAKSQNKANPPQQKKAAGPEKKDDRKKKD